MKTTNHEPTPSTWIVTTPEATFMFIGGRLKPGRDLRHVWLTNPAGDPVMEVRRECVRPLPRERIPDHLRRVAKERETCECDLCRKWRSKRNARN